MSVEVLYASIAVPIFADLASTRSECFLICCEQARDLFSACSISYGLMDRDKCKGSLMYTDDMNNKKFSLIKYSTFMN
jgi:hypothetical protein